jgi:YD repeat-containing protein
MNKYILAAVCFLIGYYIGVNEAQAQTTTYYRNAYGEQVGTARNIGNTTYFYDAYNNQVGTARPIGPPQVENRAYQPIPLMVQPMPIYTPNPASLTPMYDAIFNK